MKTIMSCSLLDSTSLQPPDDRKQLVESEKIKCFRDGCGSAPESMKLKVNPGKKTSSIFKH